MKLIVDSNGVYYVNGNLIPFDGILENKKENEAKMIDVITAFYYFLRVSVLLQIAPLKKARAWILVNHWED